ncbi:capsid assembly protein [Elioraea sp.]|uniref:capsid assembly protein n=1 Tax=Elioraea sp. TaxID=2185103 RepID=UPI0025C5A082|nr:hypothetical protein [Elioraea sp.]
MPEQPATAAPEGAPATGGTPDMAEVERMVRETTDLRQRIAQAEAAYRETEAPRLREEVRAQLEAEQRKGLPGSPDAYLAALPRRLPDGRYILTEPPGPDFRPEPGAEYIQLNRDDPQLAGFLEIAHERGLTPAQVNETIAEFVTKTVPSTRELRRAAKARQAALYEALGENGEARVAHLYGKLRAKVGDHDAAAFFRGVDTPELVTAMERVVALGDGPGFAPIGGSASADDVATLNELMATPAYWRDRDPKVMKRVTDGFARLYPGKAQPPRMSGR